MASISEGTATCGQYHDPALIWASKYGEASIVKFLVGNGPNVKISLEAKDRALELARIGRHTDVVGLLESFITAEES